jgi:protein MPE1
MLRTVEQSEIDQLDEAQRQNLMLDSDGRHVLAKTDDATWAKHLEKVKASEAAQEKAGYGDKDLESSGLECPIDKRLFVDPMKTPCCGKTYCNDCITNALIDSDLTCPGCETENIILEELKPDDEMKKKIKQYEIGKAAEKQGGEGSRSTTPTSPSQLNNANEAAATPSGSKSRSSSPVDGAAKSNKRSSDDCSGSKAEAGAAPAMKRLKSGERPKDTSEAADNRAFVPATTGGATALPINSFMPADLTTMMQNIPNMNFPMSNIPMPMSMPGMPFMPMPGMMNPAMMQNFMPQNFNPMAGMNGMNFPNPQYGMFPNNFSNPTMNNFHPASQYPSANNSHQPNGMQGVPLGPKAQQYPTGPASMSGKFSNQQRPTGKEEDNAYMRQPVNPHRHQNRQKRARPSDYREL